MLEQAKKVLDNDDNMGDNGVEKELEDLGVNYDENGEFSSEDLKEEYTVKMSELKDMEDVQFSELNRVALDWIEDNRKVFDEALERQHISKEGYDKLIGSLDELKLHHIDDNYINTLVSYTEGLDLGFLYSKQKTKMLSRKLDRFIYLSCKKTGTNSGYINLMLDRIYNNICNEDENMVRHLKAILYKVTEHPSVSSENLAINKWELGNRFIALMLPTMREKSSKLIDNIVNRYNREFLEEDIKEGE